MQKVAHPPDEFFLDVRADAGTVVVRLAGGLDLAAAGAAAAAVEERLDDGSPHVVVDLREPSFLESSEIHMPVAAQRSAERRHRAALLIRGPQHVQHVLELTATASLFTLVAAEGDG